MNIISVVIDLVLAAYITWEVIRFMPRYLQLKKDVANGDARARTSIYYEALIFEWVTALLALAALGFDWTKLNPKFLPLGDSRLIQSLHASGGFNQGLIGGILGGIAIGTVSLVIARLISKRRGFSPPPNAAAIYLSKLMPDFNALMPVTTRERLLWAAVAVSAGICEEIVFRGWLLSTLHTQLHLSGTTLIVIAAAMFGLAHSYQRLAGIILTAFLGAVFCVLFVMTGSLLVPIALHILIDLRFAILPAPRDGAISDLQAHGDSPVATAG
jgi:membrane protease YdiL (CAAX protease family)